MIYFVAVYVSAKLCHVLCWVFLVYYFSDRPPVMSRLYNRHECVLFFMFCCIWCCSFRPMFLNASMRPLQLRCFCFDFLFLSFVCILAHVPGVGWAHVQLGKLFAHVGQFCSSCASWRFPRFAEFVEERRMFPIAFCKLRAGSFCQAFA